MDEDLDGLRAWLDAHPDQVDARDDDRCTALHVAALHGRTPFVALLLERGAAVDAKAYNRFTPLHLAVMGHRTGVVRMLLEAGADTEAETSFDKRPLQLAAESGWQDLVTLLREHGATYDLHTACCLGDLERVRELAGEQGATVHRRTIEAAIRAGHAEIVAVLLGLQREPEPPMVNMEVRLPPLFLATAHPAVVQVLLDAGEDPMERTSSRFGPMRDPEGATLLHVAAGKGHLATLRLFVAGPFAEEREPLEARDRAGRTPLLLAARAGHVETVEGLVALGADLGAVDNAGHGALHHAAVEGRVEMVRWLVGEGVALDAVDNRGRTALALTTRRISPRTVEAKARLEMASFLQRHGVPVDLYSAVLLGDVARVRALLARPEHAPTFALAERAMAFRHPDVLAALIDAGLDLESQDERANTVLNMAAFWGEAPCLRIVIDRGGKLETANKFGLTPLHHAVRVNSAEAARVLLDAGADRAALDADGKPAADYVTGQHSAELRALFEG